MNMHYTAIGDFEKNKGIHIKGEALNASKNNHEKLKDRQVFEEVLKFLVVKEIDFVSITDIGDDTFVLYGNKPSKIRSFVHIPDDEKIRVRQGEKDVLNTAGYCQEPDNCAFVWIDGYTIKEILAEPSIYL